MYIAIEKTFTGDSITEVRAKLMQNCLDPDRYIIIEKPDDTLSNNITAVYKAEEITDLMKDPRYWRDQDPDFVKEVNEKFRKYYGG